MSNFNFVTDARLSQGTYDKITNANGDLVPAANNPLNTKVIDGWNPVLVKLKPGESFSGTFGAQLYEKDGQYKVVYRGTEGNLEDWQQNGKYGLGAWSPEWADTVSFMAKAIKQVADANFEGDVTKAAKLFTSTGHSQGGFEAQLASILFGVKGTSLDGMGATTMATKWKAALEDIMKKEGVGDLTGQAAPTADQFMTRVFTVVGTLGVQAGETSWAYTTKLNVLAFAINPALGGYIGVTNLAAHKMEHIIAVEQLRAKGGIWKFVEVDNILADSPQQFAQAIGAQWEASANQLASNGGNVSWVKAPQDILNLSQEFAQAHTGKIEYMQSGKTVLAIAENGDSLMLDAYGNAQVISFKGIVQTIKDYEVGGKLVNTKQIQFDDDGNALVTQSGPNFKASMFLDANGKVIAANSETLNPLATGSEIAGVRQFVNASGAKIINRTTADGHISEEAWATVDGNLTLQSSKVLSYSQAERDVAAADVALAGLELMQALRSGNKLQAAGSLIRLVNQAQVASNTQPVLGAIGTGFSGAVSILSALDSWGDASDGERIALTARAVLGANEVAKAFSADGNTGFLQNSAALGALQGVVALASLDDVLESGNPFAIASTFMALTNAAVATGMVTSATAAGALGTSAFSSAAVFGPQAMIAVAIASIIFGSLFGDDPEYPAPPPAGTAELGYLADGTLGMLFKDGDGHLYQTRSLNGQLVWQETQTMSEDRGHWANIDYGDSSQSHWVSDMRYWDEPLNQVRDNQDFGLGASVLSERLSGLIAELQTQAGKDGTHLLLERLPSVSVHGYPSFDGNGVNNFFFALKFNNAVSGAEQMLATAHQDLAAQFKEVASYAGALVGATEWAQIQAKQAAGDATVRAHATETEGQYVDRFSGDKAGDSLQSAEQAKSQADNNRQTYSLLTLDLEGDGISKRAKAEAGMSLEDVQADTIQGVTRMDVDNDGYMELTEWVGSKEAILGLDRNGDGHLSAATELLTGAELSDAAESLGVKRLAFFDANADGQLDKLPNMKADASNDPDYLIYAGTL